MMLEYLIFGVMIAVAGLCIFLIFFTDRVVDSLDDSGGEAIAPLALSSGAINTAPLAAYSSTKKEELE